MAFTSSASVEDYLARADQDAAAAAERVRHAAAPDRGAAVRDCLLPLRRLLAEPDTTDLAINGPGEIWVENDRGWHRHAVTEITPSWLGAFAIVTATFNRHVIDEKRPLLSGVLPDGERVQIIRPPAVDTDRYSITIRKPSATVKTREAYEREGLTAEVIDASGPLSAVDQTLLQLKAEQRFWDFFALAMRAKRNVVISGATGSGKTTLGKTLATFIPAHERIVTIEDVREIVLPQHPNCVHLLYSATGSSTTDVEAKALLQACLRMKPSRILLAEIRSRVAYEYIVNVSSGHPGSLTTVHAGSCAEAFEMLALRILESPEGRELSRTEIVELLRTKIDVVIQLNVREDLTAEGVQKARRVTELYFQPERKRAWA
jgi:type IV secretion system protein VirB11